MKKIINDNMITVNEAVNEYETSSRNDDFIEIILKTKKNELFKLQRVEHNVFSFIQLGKPWQMFYGRSDIINQFEHAVKKGELYLLESKEEYLDFLKERW